jgi:hypothetical protein
LTRRGPVDAGEPGDAGVPTVSQATMGQVAVGQATTVGQATMGRWVIATMITCENSVRSDSEG